MEKIRIATIFADSEQLSGKELRKRRAEERARRAEERRLATEAELTNAGQIALEEELPPDDSDLEEEARVAELLDNRLSEDDEDILDDIGLDLNEIVRTMAEQAKSLPATENTEDL